jgi:hypothetical protein
MVRDVVSETPLRTIDDVTPEWVERTLGAPHIDSARTERTRTGREPPPLHRARRQQPDRTLVVKLAARDSTSHRTGVALGLYDPEVRFYRAPLIGGPLASCHHPALTRSRDPHLLLDDASPAVHGDEINGCTVEQARLAIRELGAFTVPCSVPARLPRQRGSTGPRRSTRLSSRSSSPASPFATTTASRRKTSPRRGASPPASTPGPPQPALPKGSSTAITGSTTSCSVPSARRAITVVDGPTVTRGDALTDLAYFLG